MVSPAALGEALLDDAHGCVAALNLLRFLLLREAAGGTDLSGVRAPAALREARDSWLRPMGAALSAVVAAAEAAGPQGDPEAAALLMPAATLLMLVERSLELVDAGLAAGK